MIKLSKKIINQKLVPHLSKGQRGPKCKVGLWRIVRAILKRLKTGTQWRELPMLELFGRHTISWQTVFYYFQKWSKDGSWYRLWTVLLKLSKEVLDMSSVELDGSHTRVKRGGQAVGYQGRKKAKTTNMLFLTDRQGIPLACNDPVGGNHNDLFEIKKSVSKIINTLKDAKIEYKGLFMNADAGFDSQNLRGICEELEIIANFDINKRNSKKPDQNDYYFDNQLYKERFAVERTNAWIDGFKNLIIRYETNAKHWLGLHYLAFSIILLRKVEKFKCKL
jgi:transposase